jgi:predicted phage tail component-like protein
MLTFGGVAIPSYINVNSIEYTVLPPISQKAINMSGRAGAYDYGIDLGQRTIKANIQIIGVDEHDIIKKARTLASWLYYEDLQPLIINDEPDKQYLARINSAIDISEIGRVGQGTLEFIVPSGYAEALTDKVVTSTPPDVFTPVQVTNNGNVTAYPVIDLELTADVPNISVISNDEFVTLGNADEVGKTPTAKEPVVFTQAGSSYTGFSTGISVDYGVISGTLASNGYSIGANANYSGGSYGTGSAWHGPAGIKSIPSALTDFKVETYIGHIASATNQIGRVEVYLLDANNTAIGKIAMVDAQTSSYDPVIQARAGNLTSGYYFVNSSGAKKGIYSNFQNGVMQIWRKGKTWGVYVANVDSKGRHTNTYSKTWYDTKNLFTGKLAKIQVHIGQYGTYTPVNNMYFSYLSVRDLGVSINAATQIPMDFKSGDKLTIDNDKATVYYNGKPAFKLLDPSSDFINLTPGVNGLIVSPANAKVTVTFRERWV